MRDLDKIKECIVIRLDHGQLFATILGLAVLAGGSFGAGYLVSEGFAMESPSPRNAVADSLERSHGAPPLARIHAGTRTLTTAVKRPSFMPPPQDPTEAARIETRRQLTATRSLGPVGLTPPSTPTPRADPVTLVNREPKREAKAMKGKTKIESGFAVQVSAFRSRGPAEILTSTLRHGGYDARIREVQDARGDQFWRVLVGHFKDHDKAKGFRLRFEKTEGLATIVVPVR
jgi:cell division septation protein DedD